jgi:hypothetical protein
MFADPCSQFDSTYLACGIAFEATIDEMTLKRFILFLFVALSSSQAFASRSCEDAFAPPAHPNWLKHLAFWSVTTGAAVTPFAALAGGFGGVGGGGGVAKFADPRDARAAREFIAKGEQIPAELLSRSTLMTLDRWEMRSKGFDPFVYPEGTTWQTLHARAIENLRLVSPLVALRLEQVAEWMSFTDWVAAEGLPKYPDANPAYNTSFTDVPVQLALRLSNGNSTTDLTQNRVDLRVIFDQRAFKLMSPLDQAMLVFHEQLYALAQANGQISSDMVRQFTMRFFQEDSKSWPDRTMGGLWPSGPFPDWQQNFAVYWGDYVMYFANLDKPYLKADRTPARHLYAFTEILRYLRERQGKCMAKLNDGPECAKRNHIEFMRRPDLSDEDAFLFLSYFTLQKSMHRLTTEVFMDQKTPPEKYLAGMILAKNLLQSFRFDSDFDAARVKALRYAALEGVRIPHESSLSQGNKSN